MLRPLCEFLESASKKKDKIEQCADFAGISKKSMDYRFTQIHRVLHNFCKNLVIRLRLVEVTVDAGKIDMNRQEIDQINFET